MVQNFLTFDKISSYLNIFLYKSVRNTLLNWFYQKLRFLQFFAIFGETAEIAEIAVFAAHP